MARQPSVQTLVEEGKKAHGPLVQLGIDVKKGEREAVGAA